MTGFSKFEHEAHAEAAGPKRTSEARRRTQAYIDGHQLAERRSAAGLSQAELAKLMGVTRGRVSQIERGEVSTVAAIAVYVEALGGHLEVSAVIGDRSYRLRGSEQDLNDQLAV